MGTIDDYLATLSPLDAQLIGHCYDVALAVAPDAEQGTGYGMPALTYKGKGLLSVMRTKQHFGVYPFSAHVIEESHDILEGIDHAKGTVRFTGDSPLPDPVLSELVARRRAEIDR